VGFSLTPDGCGRRPRSLRTPLTGGCIGRVAGRHEFDQRSGGNLDKSAHADHGCWPLVGADQFVRERSGCGIATPIRVGVCVDRVASGWVSKVLSAGPAYRDRGAGAWERGAGPAARATGRSVRGPRTGPGPEHRCRSLAARRVQGARGRHRRWTQMSVRSYGRNPGPTRTIPARRLRVTAGARSPASSTRSARASGVWSPS